MTQTIEYLPGLFYDLYAGVLSHVAARQSGDSATPTAEAAADLLDRHLQGNWARVSDWRQKEIDRLPPRERQVAQAAADAILLRLRQISPVGSMDPVVVGGFSKKLSETAQVAGEWLVAMRLVGESEEIIEFVRAMLTEVLHDALVAGTAYQMALAEKTDVRTIAPAVLAAVIARAQSATGMSAVDAAVRFDLDDGMVVSPEKFQAISARFSDVLRGADQRITETLRGYSAMAKQAFAPEPEKEPWWLKDDPLREYYPKQPRVPRPRIRIGPLLAFGASAGGGSEDARVRGAFDLFHSISSRYLDQSQASDLSTARFAAFNESVFGLQRLEKEIASERATHSDVEQRWREIESEMKFLRRQNPNEAVVFPFPDEFTALECRALYYQDAITRGVPLGVVLAELHDSPRMTFGPSERLFFERVACYAARKHAATFAAQADPRLNGDVRQDLRLEDVRAVLSQIEVEIRKHEHLSDDELLEFGEARLREAVDQGELRMNEYRYLTGRSTDSPWGANEGAPSIARSSIVLDMVLRARSAQEVREVTAQLAVSGGVAKDTIANYRQLPHTRARARFDPPEAHLALLTARNGQSLAELERDSRARWLRYRQQMPAGVDVSPIVIPGDSETQLDNPMRLKSRRHFRKRPIGYEGIDERERGREGELGQEERGGRGSRR